MLLDILLLIGLLLVSAFFSGSEMAYVLSNKLKIEIRARKKTLPGICAHYFSEKPEQLFSTILIGNNIFNIAYASISAVIFTLLFQLNEWEILIISTLLLLLFGELIPKYIAREIPNIFFFSVAVPLRGISFILAPFVKITSALSRFFIRSKGLQEEGFSNIILREDLEMLVQESGEAGMVNRQDSDTIQKVIQLREQHVSEAMRPRTEIVGIEINAAVVEAIDLFVDSGFSKILVFEENVDNIKGVVFAYDFFKNPASLAEITREVVFVPETKKSIDMLNDFLRKGVSIAVVVDEFGGTAGIVTTEDIIEELLGEIKDEYDVEEEICRQVDERSYMFSGKVEIDYINEKFEISLPEENYNTISGWITAETGMIPEQGSVIELEGFQILIIRSTPVKVDLVKLTMKEDLY